MKSYAVSFLLILIVLVFSLAGCAGINKEVNSVAVVNGEDISKEKFETQIDQIKLIYQQQQGIDLEAEENKELFKEIKEQVLNEMIDQLVFLQKAKEKGIKISSQEVQKEIDLIKQQLGSDENFNEALKANNITLEELKEEMEKQLRIEKYLRQEISEEKIKVTDQEIKDYYNGYKEQVPEPEGFEELKESIEDIIRQQKIETERNELLERLKSQSEIEIFL